jgi:16S rRNA (uracil1498-N3)-methyltransferase
VGQRIELDTAHARGLRFRGINVKEAFTIVDARGGFFRASLTALDADSGAATVYEAMATPTESRTEITLLCAVLARQRMLVVVQKATELGVIRIVPVLSERSVQRNGLAHEKAHAWPGQALRASRQCRRASVPLVSGAIPLEAALDEDARRGTERRFYLDDHPGGLTLHPSAHEREVAPSSIALVVGPEGGFTDGERSLLESRRSTPLRLGGRVLRAETAVLVGLTLLQHWYGDM